ncbi:MAG: hypothetical protein F4Y61_05155 [Rhodothermaceae bacterium]|nr:hypothetical protein [Rhodothermaceae bacterium]
MLGSDLRLLARITAKGSITGAFWLRRSALRAATPVVLAALSTLSMDAAGASVWSAAAWTATMLGIWLAWTKSSSRRDSFVVAVHDVWIERTLNSSN